jgi:hypothetical protein
VEHGAGNLSGAPALTSVCTWPRSSHSHSPGNPSRTRAWWVGARHGAQPLELRSRVRYQADYDLPGMSPHSRSPLLGPFPCFPSRSREDVSPSMMRRRSSGPIVTLRSLSHSRSCSPPNPTSSPPPDSRAAPASSLEPLSEPSPDQVELYALRGDTKVASRCRYAGNEGTK